MREKKEDFGIDIPQTIKEMQLAVKKELCEQEE